jgi:hypothetical protein
MHQEGLVNTAARKPLFHPNKLLLLLLLLQLPVISTQP